MRAGPRVRPSPRASAGRERRGFTLLEMLIAMALLATLGAFLGQLVQGSFELYQQGDRRGDLYENAVAIQQLLEGDLLALHGGPEGRFLLQTTALGGGPGKGDGLLLRLVRTMPHGEMRHPVLRRAGEVPDAAESFDGSDPGIGRRGELAPPSGLLEVAYALLPEPADEEERPGILTLYRGVHAPALGKGSFFDKDLEGRIDETWVRKHLQPVATDILGLWILCYGQNAAEWGELDVLDGTRREGVSGIQWDSTRGLLSEEAFPLARGKASAEDPRDDIFPRLVRIVLHVARGSRPDAQVRSTFRPDQEVLRVSSSRFLPGPDDEDRFVKIGNEWLYVVNADSSDVQVRRGRRHTGALQVQHGPGTPVYAGTVFRRTLPIPAKRSYWIGGGQ